MRLNKVDICGVDTSKLKTLTEERKKELLRLSKAGDRAAREELILGNLRLVLSIIQRFTNRRENLDDLFHFSSLPFIFTSRSALLTTNSELILMAAEPIMGLSCSPNTG